MENCCDINKRKVSVGHVRFPDNIDPHNVIHVEDNGVDKVQVHVGFLQTNHKYEIQFDVPNLFGESVAAIHNLTKSIDLTVVDVKPTDSSNKTLHVLIHLSLVKEGLMEESFLLQNEEKKELSVMIEARVLGKHTGTPMVKDGVHCLEVYKDKESLSDTEFS